MEIEELKKQHIHKHPPLRSGLYLKLLHGRKTPEENLDDWGPDGPWIGPLVYAHITYLSHISVGFTDGSQLGPGNKRLELEQDLLRFDDMYYGDIELMQYETPTEIRVVTPSFTITVWPWTMRGYFEHHEHGDNCGGGLWFARDELGALTLVDYDGIFELPREVWSTLEEMNIVVEDEFK